MIALFRAMTHYVGNLPNDRVVPDAAIRNLKPLLRLSVWLAVAWQVRNTDYLREESCLLATNPPMCPK